MAKKHDETSEEEMMQWLNTSTNSNPKPTPSEEDANWNRVTEGENFATGPDLIKPVEDSDPLDRYETEEYKRNNPDRK